jgi:hypothetical protein
MFVHALHNRNTDWTVSRISKVKVVWLEYVLCLYDATVVEENFDYYLLLIHLLLLLLLGQVICVCVILVSPIPAGTLRLGLGLPKQLMTLLRVRAPGLTSSAAPVWTGVRSCGLKRTSADL